MPDLSAIATFLNAELRLAEIPDYPNAYNGLQLQNRSGQVTKVAAAVDACLPSMKLAVAEGANLLVVHHGMFWRGQQMLTGPHFEKLCFALDHDLAIFSAHLPLDVHPSLGNNYLLGQACGLSCGEPFAPWKGVPMGLRFSVELHRDALLEAVSRATGAPVHLCPGGPEDVRHIGLITGGAGESVASIAEAGIDTFITGEGPHWSYTLAEELGINVLYAGHYATETFGVKALASLLADTFKIPSCFVDHPTGL